MVTFGGYYFRKRLNKEKESSIYLVFPTGTEHQGNQKIDEGIVTSNETVDLGNDYHSKERQSNIMCLLMEMQTPLRNTLAKNQILP